MGVSNAFILCLTILTVTEALIEFAKSRLYDETDFEGTAITYLPNYCDAGCQIFVSVPDTSVDIAKSIYIDDSTGKQTSLPDADTRGATGRKMPFVVQPKSTMKIHNYNFMYTSAPVAVWVVQGDAPNINTAEVYDAKDDFLRGRGVASLITVMNAEPFSVSTQTFGPMTSIGYMAGFDALNSGDRCVQVIRQRDASFYEDIIVSVHSPLFTLSFDSRQFPDTEVAVQITKGEVPSFDLSKPMFAASPGYIGCKVNFGRGLTKTFRSSLYAARTDYHFKSDDSLHFIISADLNIDWVHPVVTKVDDEHPTIWSGFDTTPAVNFNGRKLEISWTRNDDDLDEYFLLRVQPENVPVPTTVVTTTTTKPTTTQFIRTSPAVPVKPATTVQDPTTLEQSLQSTTAAQENKSTAAADLKTTAPNDPTHTANTAQPSIPSAEDTTLPAKSTTGTIPKSTTAATTTTSSFGQSKLLLSVASTLLATLFV